MTEAQKEANKRYKKKCVQISIRYNTLHQADELNHIIKRAEEYGISKGEYLKMLVREDMK